MSFPFHDFIRGTQASLLLGHPKQTFEGVSIDTRTLKKGDLFFAIAGPRHDGHDHISEAVERGAVGCVLQTVDQRVRFPRNAAPALFHVTQTVEALQEWARHVRRQSRATVIGITGSNGKTTTKEMLAAILSRVSPTLATQGNLNNHLGLPLTMSRLQAAHRFVILEMGASRPGDIALLTDIGRPQIGVITNIGKAHLEGLGSSEGILKEKRALLDSLPPDGVAVINQDDSRLAGIAASLRSQKVYFGLTALADVRGESVEEKNLSIDFVLNVRGQRAAVHLAVPGRFQVLNALAAAAVAHAAGISLENIVAGLNQFRPVAMRMQALAHPSGALLINDAYNANPSSVRASIQSLCEAYRDRPRWLVLGDMRELGSGAQTEHYALGVWLALQPLERVFLYGRDTRFVMKGLEEQKTPVLAARFRKKKWLISALQTSLGQKPVILFKGSRAMRLEDIVKALQL